MLYCFMEGMMKTIIRYAPVAMKQPDNYEARANLMWTSSWAINGFANGGKRQAWSCHPMEHGLSALYDITHGLGLAILTPRRMEYCLDETTVSKYVQFGVNVFGIHPALPPMDVAKKAIEMLFRLPVWHPGAQEHLRRSGHRGEEFPGHGKEGLRGRHPARFQAPEPGRYREDFRHVPVIEGGQSHEVR
jgi:alcohol dehydrogenase YqhD (iron-dependent ADH family)